MSDYESDSQGGSGDDYEEDEQSNDGSEESDEQDENDETKDDELRNLPLGERVKLQRETLPAKIFKKRKAQKLLNKQEKQQEGSSQPSLKSRPNKNYPAVVSSKRRVSRHREISQSQRSKARDPRFDDLSGRLNYAKFHQAYDFLENSQEQEINTLKKLKKKTKGPKNEAISAALARSQQQMAERRRALRLREKLGEKKREEREAVAQGKQPYFLKGSAVKQLAMENRYEELKSQGKLEKFLQKKRKRNAAKDHRWLPSRRMRTEEEP